ncbi:hypothetical protein DWY99_11300 [[Clostridium] leptum]|uniref:Uncharacterized protein n=1 Tax=[Clostridium] leptum TaxID=1535 RepID=A0A412AV94_9FIRM|nr:hypothetical protein DWY99_11300 [[Clostridium] leptum]
MPVHFLTAKFKILKAIFYSALRFSGANQLLSAQKAVSRQSYGKLRKQKRTGLFFIVSDPPPSFKLKNCLQRTGRGFSFVVFSVPLTFLPIGTIISR